METVLLTGFEPFADATRNPSWDAARVVADEWTAETRVVAKRLPVSFARAHADIRRAVAEHRPSVVIALGVAEGRARLGVERVALNLADAPIPDNDGATPHDAPVVQGAPDGLFSTLPIKRILQAWEAARLPGEISHSAGTFVCNHVFFALQHALRGSGVRSGFIHVPATAGMRRRTSGPVLTIEDIVDGVRLAIGACSAHAADAHAQAGALH